TDARRTSFGIQGNLTTGEASPARRLYTAVAYVSAASRSARGKPINFRFIERTRSGKLVRDVASPTATLTARRRRLTASTTVLRANDNLHILLEQHSAARGDSFYVHAISGVTSLPALQAAAGTPGSTAGSPLTVSYAGMDYEQPSGPVTGCNYYTWLEPSCYTNTTLTSYHVSPQQQLAREMNWITANHMGSFQRVFVSLDELFSCFDPTTGFCGYSSNALA